MTWLEEGKLLLKEWAEANFPVEGELRERVKAWANRRRLPWDAALQKDAEELFKPYPGMFEMLKQWDRVKKL